MPLLLSGEVPHAVMLWLMNGDNWQKAIIDMFNAHVLTQDPDAAGANVQRLGVFAPFIDLRQDRRSRKPIPGSAPNEMAIVKAQASWSMALANLMKYVAKVDYLVNLDGHSHLATTHFQEVGIDVVNVSGKRVILMDDMISSGGTLVHTVELLLSQGAAEVLVCASHPVFAGREYYSQLQRLLKYDKVKIVMTTDTLPLERPEFGGDKSKPYVLEPGQAVGDHNPKNVNLRCCHQQI